MQWGDLAGAIIKTGATGLGTVIGGPLGASLGSVVGKEIARRLGVDATPEAVGQAIQNDPRAADVVQAVEAEHAALIVELEKKALDHQLALAQLDREEGLFSWGWRPGGMWLIGFLWLQNCTLAPLVSLFTDARVPMIPWDQLMVFTGLFSGFYMGGHTIKDAIKTWRSAR